MSTAMGSESKLIKEADALMDQAWKARRLVDSHHYFLCAADLYQQAGDDDSARWASMKADQYMRVLSHYKQ